MMKGKNGTQEEEKKPMSPKSPVSTYNPIEVLYKKELKELQNLAEIRLSMDRLAQLEKSKEMKYEEMSSKYIQKNTPLVREEIKRIGNRYLERTKPGTNQKTKPLAPLNTEMFELDEIYRHCANVGTKTETVFGERLRINADYSNNLSTLSFFENAIAYLMTEVSGNIWNQQSTADIATKKALDTIIQSLKEYFRADTKDVVSFSYISASQSICDFQRIIGVTQNPASRQTILECYAVQSEEGQDWLDKEFFVAYLLDEIRDKLPVVILGPDEPFYNDITWKECLCEMMYMKKDKTGDVDLNHLEFMLNDEKLNGRLTVACFSACSPVTGRIYSYQKITEILKRFHAVVCLDASKLVPFQRVLLSDPKEKEKRARPDALVASLDQLIGGAGAPAVLVFNPLIYNKKLPPLRPTLHNIAYSDPEDTNYYLNTQLRELDERPPLDLLYRGHYALSLHKALNQEKIEARTKKQVEQLKTHLHGLRAIKVLSEDVQADRVPMISFVIYYKDKQLHPRYVARLLYDLFGIMVSFEHSNASQFDVLLRFNRAQIDGIKDLVKEEFYSIVPGWNKIVLSPLVDDDELEYIINAVKVVAEFGIGYITEYAVDLYSGKWKNIREKDKKELENVTVLPELSKIMTEQFENKEKKNLTLEFSEFQKTKKELFDGYLKKARDLGHRLIDRLKRKKLEEKIEALKVGVDKYDKVKYFYIANIIDL